jgi:Xaa-Pro aminopeptidase
MYQAVLHVREQVLSAVKPGATQRGLVEVYQRACAESGFRSSPHSQIHQYGIDVPEFPGPAFNASDESGRGGRADFVLAPGMIYSISPTLEDGFRELGDRKVELLIAES